MIVRNPDVLRAPARRMNVLIALFNVWIYAFALLALLIVLTSLLPETSRGSLKGLMVGMSWVVVVLGVLVTPGWFAIRLGFIKCPCCGETFGSDKLGWHLARACANCGFDVRTVSRPGDF
jgi:hypothetical protein